VSRGGARSYVHGFDINAGSYYLLKDIYMTK
jgi:hypothetical protein